MNAFWPVITGVTFVDVWTLAHLGFWISVSSTLWAFKVPKKTAFLSCLGVAFLWEIFEHFIAFNLWPERWQDPESLLNGWVSDPLTCSVSVLGVWYLWDRRKRRKELTE